MDIPLQFEEAQGIGDAGALLLDILGELLLGPIEGLLKGLIGAGQFDGIEVFPLEVLGQSQ